MARASARQRPAERPALAPAWLSAVTNSPRSSLPISARGRSTGNGAPLLAVFSRFSRSSGRCGRKTETKRLMTELHVEAPPRRFAPATLERELPRRASGRHGIEGHRTASSRGDAPRRDGSGKVCVAMIGEQEAGRARTLRGEAETACHERGLGLDGGKRCDQRAALQTLFESPGCIGFIPGHHDKEKSGVEAISDEPRSVRAAPFPRRLPRQAPQNEVAGRVP